MSTKSCIWLGVTIGSLLGGYLPTFFGQGALSTWSLVGSTIGGILGIWAGYRIGSEFF